MTRLPALVTISQEALLTVSGGSSTNTNDQHPEHKGDGWSHDLHRIVESGGKPRNKKERDAQHASQAIHNANDLAGALSGVKTGRR